MEKLNPKQPPGKKLADFDYDEDAYSEYLSEQAAEKAEKLAEEHAQQRQIQERDAHFSARESAYAEKVDDYYRITRDARHTWLSPEVVESVKIAEQGEKVLEYLCRNPEVGELFSALPPHQKLMEIGRIEASKLDDKPKSVSKTPPPPPKIKPTDSAIEPDPAEMSQDKFEKWREKFISKR